MLTTKWVLCDPFTERDDNNTNLWALEIRTMDLSIQKWAILELTTGPPWISLVVDVFLFGQNDIYRLPLQLK